MPGREMQRESGGWDDGGEQYPMQRPNCQGLDGVVPADCSVEMLQVIREVICTVRM